MFSKKTNLLPCGSTKSERAVGCWLNAGGGGADAGDVGEGGDISHTHQRPGEVDSAAGNAPAPGHAQIYEHHQGVAGIRIDSVRRGGERITTSDFHDFLQDTTSNLFLLQCKEGGFPHDLWLGVSADNVSVYKRGEPKPLETFQYEHITFFGASQPCTYKVIVDEREMFFETPLVNSCPSVCVQPS